MSVSLQVVSRDSAAAGRGLSALVRGCGFCEGADTASVLRVGDGVLGERYVELVRLCSTAIGSQGLSSSGWGPGYHTLLSWAQGADAVLLVILQAISSSSSNSSQ